MANGGPPLPTPRPAPSSMPNMPRSPAAIGQTPSSALLLHPQHDHHLIDRASFETLTSIASSNPAHPSAQQLRHRPACNSSSPSFSPNLFLSPEHPPTRPTNPRPGQIRSKYHYHRASSNPSNLSPPLRDLPPLRAPHEAVQRWRRASLEADQFLEGSSDEEDDEVEMMILHPAGLDLSLGRLYGFPYCMGVSDVMEQRSRAVAEAEEAEYQREREVRQKGRLSRRVSSAFKWTRRR
ncbi:hypothetical protein Q7P35_006271 [Cladosporium inversicolor]